MIAGPKPLSHIRTMSFGSFFIVFMIAIWGMDRLVAGFCRVVLSRARVRFVSSRSSRFSRAGGPGFGSQSDRT